mmetsp:Transcript_26506/g.84347  ORF Transcript_26506/g.84347 Transcript_26506/m.84347 type:complete len:241 (-) Transcript_26506:36-758(-)
MAVSSCLMMRRKARTFLSPFTLHAFSASLSSFLYSSSALFQSPTLRLLRTLRATFDTASLALSAALRTTRLSSLSESSDSSAQRVVCCFFEFSFSESEPELLELSSPSELSSPAQKRDRCSVAMAPPLCPALAPLGRSVRPHRTPLPAWQASPPRCCLRTCSEHAHIPPRRAGPKAVPVHFVAPVDALRQAHWPAFRRPVSFSARSWPRPLHLPTRPPLERISSEGLFPSNILAKPSNKP